MSATRFGSVKRRKLIFLAALALVIFCVLIFRNAILVSLGEYLITQHPLEKADAIVVLGGSIPDRIMEAVDIYREGYAPLIILTKEPKPEGYDELLKLGIKIPEGYNLNQMTAVRLGVPASSIIVTDERSDSTYSEAQTLYSLLKKKNFKSIILVTSKSHTTRATRIFNHVTDGKIKIITRPSRYDSFNPKNWWKVRDYLRETLYEYQKFFYYYLFDYGSTTN